MQKGKFLFKLVASRLGNFKVRRIMNKEGSPYALVAAWMALASVSFAVIIFWKSTLLSSLVSCCLMVLEMSLAQDSWVGGMAAIFSMNSSLNEWPLMILAPKGTGARTGYEQIVMSFGAVAHTISMRNSGGRGISGRILPRILLKFWMACADPTLAPSILMKAGSLFSLLRFPMIVERVPSGQ
jgi:hypothetical protein